MADSTKIPVITDPAGLGAPADLPARVGTKGEVPEKPAWMKPERAKIVAKRQAQPAPAPPPPLSVGAKGADSLEAGTDLEAGADAPLKTRIVSWLRTAAATGYGMSLLIHALLMLGMALWIFPQITESTSITTVVESDDEAPQLFDAMDDVQLEAPAGSEEVVEPQLAEVIQEDADLNVLEHQFLQDVTAAETQGEGGASDVGKGGFRLLEPKNAVKAGSFSAWTIPIVRRFGEQAKAGDSPRPGQDYHIVIQARIPGKRKSYKINDLSGRVIGTDGYVQIIPLLAFIQDENGRLIRAKAGRRVPVVDGVVQILVRVPGASALVKDTIRVKSKLLKEQQTLEIIFGERFIEN